MDKAFSLIDESSMSHAELEAQHKRKEWIFIQKSSLKLAEEKGHEAGLMTAAKNMVSAGMTLDTVSQLTGLTEAQLKTLG